MNLYTFQTALWYFTMNNAWASIAMLISSTTIMRCFLALVAGSLFDWEWLNFLCYWQGIFFSAPDLLSAVSNGWASISTTPFYPLCEILETSAEITYGILYVRGFHYTALLLNHGLCGWNLYYLYYFFLIYKFQNIDFYNKYPQGSSIYLFIRASFEDFNSASSIYNNYL